MGRVQTANSTSIPDGAKNGIALPLLRVDNINYNLSVMSRAELMELSALLSADIDNIELQRQSGHTGAWANPDWEPKAQYAQKMKGRQIALIQAELSRRKESLPSLARLFMDRAFEMLPREVFDSIAEVAKKQHKESLQTA